MKYFYYDDINGSYVEVDDIDAANRLLETSNYEVYKAEQMAPVRTVEQVKEDLEAVRQAIEPDLEELGNKIHKLLGLRPIEVARCKEWVQYQCVLEEGHDGPHFYFNLTVDHFVW